MKKSLLLRFRDDFEQAYRNGWENSTFYGTLRQAAEFIDAGIFEPYGNQLDVFYVPTEVAWKKLCALYPELAEKLEAEKIFQEKKQAWTDAKVKEFVQRVKQEGLWSEVNDLGFAADRFWINISRLSSNNRYLHIMYPDSNTSLNVYINEDLEKRFDEIRKIHQLLQILNTYQAEYESWLVHEDK